MGWRAGFRVLGFWGLTAPGFQGLRGLGLYWGFSVLGFWGLTASGFQGLRGLGLYWGFSGLGFWGRWVFPASASSKVPSLQPISTVYLRGAQTLCLCQIFFCFLSLCHLSFLLLSFRLGVALQRSFCISVFLPFRLGVTLQLCFVLAIFHCCFLLARLVIIQLFVFLSSVLSGS